MSSEASPRPWHFNGMRPTIYSDEKLPDGSARVVLDVKTDHLPLLPCDENDRQLIADLALIVAAVNERDRLAADEARYRAHNVVLRDIVRRLLPLAETTVENIRALGTARFPFMEQIKSDRLRGDINREVANADYLLREARAALGEGVTQ